MMPARGQRLRHPRGTARSRVAHALDLAMALYRAQGSITTVRIIAEYADVSISSAHRLLGTMDDWTRYLHDEAKHLGRQKAARERWRRQGRGQGGEG